jgi:NADH-quinone oxidoreductase subunit E/NADP-reducing hydrogenase subunit HndA
MFGRGKLSREPFAGNFRSAVARKARTKCAQKNRKRRLMHVEISNKDAKFAELDKHIADTGADGSMLIATLHKAQDIFGFLPIEVQNHVARKLSVPASKVYGVVTFYAFFKMVPKGKIHVSVCTGTACFVTGAEKLVEEFKKEMKINPGETSADAVFSFECLRCVGACGLAPVLSVNGKVYGRVKPEEVKGIVAENVGKEGVA